MYNPYQLDHPTPTHKDFIDTTDFDQSEMLDMIKLSTTVRDYLASGKTLNSLYHKNLAMIFERASLRTRTAFEAALSQLGGHAINFAPTDLQLGMSETISDTANTLSRMCDLMVARVDQHEKLLELAAKSSIPVINGMSNWNSPVCELSDIITIFDHLPEGKPLDKVKVVFVGDCSQICASLMMIASKMGMQFVQYAPPAKWLADEYLKIGRANNQRYGGAVHVSDNPVVLEGADFVYAGTWYNPYAQNIDREVYLREFYPKYQVTSELLASTGNEQVKFMHALPANRDEEVTADVIDGSHSIVWDQAGNRLTAARGLALYFGGVAEEALDEIKKQKED